MKKQHTVLIVLLIGLFSWSMNAQDMKSSRNSDTPIEGLSFYPNPASNGKIYISSKSGADKEITIFDVLGKVVLQTELTARELNISNLNPGVYIIQFKEGDATATRKLIVR
ncbi:secretion protein [Flavobacterium branchiophilum]|uniref:Putative secreted protein (Por secretion system target) n=1 Tax=Flavobacterium branchiophilum TaxID=55197 RepID=A0A543G1U5_9FLAO|nr:T9SS type A sorting domain-containing protein [Flavobacterium branchiophilum]OXA73790.1 secretion protein [Flavobacterium branchiophilum] [Flavobacterium branchiophilum NBRC 15030 = ATCC 35035]TQM40080.1 putative secreted protein (Por secretion system target) [Flavobacterium branchiophilum]